MRSEVLIFRAKPDELAIADNLAERMECSRSEVLRRLLRAAEDAAPATVTINFGKANSAGVRQDMASAVVA